MKKIGLLLLMSVLAACSGEHKAASDAKQAEKAMEKAEEAKDTFCEDLNEFATAVAAVTLVDESTNVAELKKRVADAKAAYLKLERSQARMEKAQGKAVSDAYDAYQSAVNAISEQDTLGEAAANVAGLRGTLDVALADISTTECAVGGP
jgi:hypothetical protein